MSISSSMNAGVLGLAANSTRLSAIADNLAALQIRPDDAGTINNLAWLWAACPADAIRDPQRAVEYARKACEATEYGHPGYLDTLAVALAALYPRGRWLFASFAALACFQRLEAQAHFASDVLAGAALGCLVGAACRASRWPSRWSIGEPSADA